MKTNCIFGKSRAQDENLGLLNFVFTIMFLFSFFFGHPPALIFNNFLDVKQKIYMLWPIKQYLKKQNKKQSLNGILEVVKVDLSIPQHGCSIVSIICTTTIKPNTANCFWS